MKPLFAAGNLKLLESLSFTKTLFAFDFDGTLSKIVPVPSEATIAPRTSALLQQLSELVPMALISGRSVQDLKSRLSFSPSFLVGNHGLEGLGTRTETLENAQRICASWKTELQQRFHHPEMHAGMEIEDKLYSLALHYRNCRSKKEAKLQILEAVANLNPPPRIILGKSVVNVLPPGAPHKGAAIMELMLQTQVRSAFYIGDDDTDEDVFSLPDSRIFTVRVGRKQSSQARYYIRDRSEIDRLLRTLIRFHQPSREKASKVSAIYEPA